MSTYNPVGKCGRCGGNILCDGRYHNHCALCGALSRNETYVFPPQTASEKAMAEEFSKPDRIINGERFPRND